MTDDSGDQTKMRIHAIVLTRNRPKILRRCVVTALSALGPQDVLTVLDDSLPAGTAANAAVLSALPTISQPTRIHVSTSRVKAVVLRSLFGAAPEWLSKTAPRDIAPLRNLSLLLSVAVPAETTILIDDDIHGFDLSATHAKIGALGRHSAGVIVGADICGVNEHDTITRLAEAIDMLEGSPHGAEMRSIRELFQVRRSSPPGVLRYVSGGYLAFRIPRQRQFAFPPGYNEDWLWCLLHSRDAQMRIYSSGETVVHDPPSMRRPTRDDVLFELLGDLIFDCIEDRQQERDSDPEAALRGIPDSFPRPDSMPSNRALELLERARPLNQNGTPLAVLDAYGLKVLADMLRAGELDMDGRRVGIRWRDDAIAKQRSFAATLQDDDAITALKALLQEQSL